MQASSFAGLFLATVIFGATPSLAQHLSTKMSGPAKVAAAVPTWDLNGAWTYRSYRNKADVFVGSSPDQAKAALDLLFGEGVMTLKTSGTQVTGMFDMGDGFVLDLSGSATLGADGVTRVNLSGPGRANSPTDGWEYDYVGFLAPKWAAGIDQVPAIVGTVLRAKPHGSAAAGYTASFTAVKQ